VSLRPRSSSSARGRPHCLGSSRTPSCARLAALAPPASCSRTAKDRQAPGNRPGRLASHAHATIVPMFTCMSWHRLLSCLPTWVVVFSDLEYTCIAFCTTYRLLLCSLVLPPKCHENTLSKKSVSKERYLI
jgi:hypothetical protein